MSSFLVPVRTINPDIGQKKNCNVLSEFSVGLGTSRECKTKTTFCQNNKRHMKTTNEVAEGPEKHEEVKIAINGEQYEVHEGLTAVDRLKRIAEIPLHDLLEKEAHGHPEPLPDHGEVDVHGGNVFISHKRAVKIKINNVDYETHPGENSVNHLKHLGHVPEDEILSEFKDGQFVDLADNANVMIHGGEVFAGHRKSGGSS